MLNHLGVIIIGNFSTRSLIISNEELPSPIIIPARSAVKLYSPSANSISTFFSLSIPLIRPAIIAGVALVAMETLADFGAVQHFAIPTFTTGIFRTWTGLYDLNTALQLSTMLLKR